MIADVAELSKAAVLGALEGTRDALSVRRVFGDPLEIDGATVIPVAHVSGGAGGGGGAGTAEDVAGAGTTEDVAGSGTGFGSGFGLGLRPLGVYEVRDGHVRWRPAVDVNRLAKGGQVLAGIVAICVTLVVLRRRGGGRRTARDERCRGGCAGRYRARSSAGRKGRWSI